MDTTTVTFNGVPLDGGAPYYIDGIKLDAPMTREAAEQFARLARTERALMSMPQGFRYLRLRLARRLVGDDIIDEGLGR